MNVRVGVAENHTQNWLQMLWPITRSMPIRSLQSPPPEGRLGLTAIKLLQYTISILSRAHHRLQSLLTYFLLSGSIHMILTTHKIVRYYRLRWDMRCGRYKHCKLFKYLDWVNWIDFDISFLTLRSVSKLEQRQFRMELRLIRFCRLCCYSKYIVISLSKSQICTLLLLKIAS